MTKQLLYSFLLLISSLALGQDADSEYTYPICECCTHSIFGYGENDYDDLFPPATIKENKLKEVTIYTTSKQTTSASDTTLQLVDNEYKEMMFLFNRDGYVETQIVFNSRGQYHSAYDFKRDGNNKILTKTFHYLDSNGTRLTDFIPEKWIYKYAENRLIQIKQLGNNFVENPDRKSTYVSYEYNRKGRVINEKEQFYYDAKNFYSYQTTIKYKAITRRSVSIKREKENPFLRVKSKYSKSGKPINIETIDDRNDELLQEKIYTYNDEDYLIHFQVKNSGMGTECPDGNNYENSYSYSSIQLISSIIHHYENTFCELRFTYQ